MLFNLVFAAAVAACPGASEKTVFWGDLHIHTAYSMDAYVFNNRDDPASAYRFARGQPRRLPDGSTISIDRPLDFAAVTDHAEYFGVMGICRGPGRPAYCDELDSVSDGRSRKGFSDFFLPFVTKNLPICPVDPEACTDAAVDLWQRTIDAAESAYEPCEFTTFIANEWTRSPNNLHWHRNLIYASNVVPSRPINVLDEPTNSDLWHALEVECGEVEGCDVLAIPHNSNWSLGGASFELGVDDPLRARFEKLIEIHQYKGNSECFPGSALADEACGFEIAYPPGLRVRGGNGELTEDERRDIASGYVRNLLAQGLASFGEDGLNPLQLGIMASTDSHSARPGYVAERGWRGHTGNFDLSDERRASSLTLYNPGGLIGVWAEENTREAIFRAMQRRETFGTSGPRIRVKLEQTFDQEIDLCADSKTSAAPRTLMGGTFEAEARNPVFFVGSMKDRAELDLVQIIKLALVAGSVEQSMVSLAPRPCARWVDTRYDPSVPALYYVRVLEAPTQRWQGDDKIRERAWTSPIWAVPAPTRPPRPDRWQGTKATDLISLTH